MTFTAEQLATLHTLMADHHGQEMLLLGFEHHVQLWAYDHEGLIFTAQVDELGGIRVFEWTGALA